MERDHYKNRWRQSQTIADWNTIQKIITILNMEYQIEGVIVKIKGNLHTHIGLTIN